MSTPPADRAGTDAPFTEQDCRPQVVLPSGGMPTWVMAAMAGTLGVVVLLSINAQPRVRLATLDNQRYAAGVTPPLPRALDRDPGSALGLDGVGRAATGDAMPRSEDSYEEAAFARAPVYGTSGGVRPDPFAQPAPFSGPVASIATGVRGSEGGPKGFSFPTAPMPGAPGGAGPSMAGTGGSAVVYDVGRSGGAAGADDKGFGDTGARASLIRNRPMIVAQGEVLAATLETPVNSLRPGPIRAVVARDVRGFDGSRVLIPRGSRLIGEYRADPAPGRRRVLATWTRLIRPDGVAIRIDSPAADALGGTGMPGKVDTHFLARFLNSTLQTAMQVGVNLASRGGDRSVIVTNATQLSAATGPSIIPGADDPPTVSVRPGAAISVFVARDLDFSRHPPSPMTGAAMTDDYLATFLAPLRPYLERPDTTDVYINTVGELWIESGGGAIERRAAPGLTESWLWQLAQQAARISHQGISRAQPLLSATLPCGTRMQVVAPPATRQGFAIAFRRQITAAFTLADLRAAAMFDGTARASGEDPDDALVRLYAAGDLVGFLTAAVRRRKTIVVSGGTSSGKTTLVNALLREVPAHERIVAIEDSAELLLAQPNAVGLIATRGEMGESRVDTDDLLRAALRLRPDRIVLGEIRGPEALTFLRAVNTGHPGSLTTIHADSPARALDQLAMLALQSGARIGTAELREHIDRVVDVVVQLERTPNGRRVVAIEWRNPAASTGTAQP